MFRQLRVCHRGILARPARPQDSFLKGIVCQVVVRVHTTDGICLVCTCLHPRPGRLNPPHLLPPSPRPLHFPRALSPPYSHPARCLARSQHARTKRTPGRRGRITNSLPGVSSHSRFTPTELVNSRHPITPAFTQQLVGDRPPARPSSPADREDDESAVILSFVSSSVRIALHRQPSLTPVTEADPWRQPLVAVQVSK